MGDGVWEARALNQSKAEERKGRRMRMDGRVKPWSWTSSGEGMFGLDFEAWARRSLFLRTRRRFLWGV